MGKQVQADVVLIGAGIMSATLGTLLRQLDNRLNIVNLEKLDKVAEESTDGWNNAGTGHSAFCELNYTPDTPHGVDISKAVKIAEKFELSREWWSTLVATGVLDPSEFIHHVPHMSCVWGADNVDFLRRRHSAMIKNPLFEAMLFSDDRSQLQAWMPLMMDGRRDGEPMAATYMPEGTDVNFGALTRALYRHLRSLDHFTLHLGEKVTRLKKRNGQWHVTSRGRNGRVTYIAPFVFIGAGGGALPLLEKSGIPEGRGYGGFPVSGEWLICTNRSVIERHDKKVYGTAATGTPPMSVPHLDTRHIAGRRELLFGPFAGLTTRFTNHGSVWDLFRSLRWGNILPMIAAGLRNIPLTRYLVGQVTLTHEQRVEQLRQFVPTAKADDWRLAHAGKRVQVIKKDPKKVGALEFGTELVHAKDGSLAALLGASPGASVALSIMLELLEKCFPQRLAEDGWKRKLAQMVPTYGMSEAERAASRESSRERTNAVLHLKMAHRG